MKKTAEIDLFEYSNCFNRSYKIMLELVAMSSVEFVLKDVLEIQLEDYNIPAHRFLELFHSVFKPAFYNTNNSYINRVKKKAGLMLLQKKMKDNYWKGDTIKLMIQWFNLKSSGEVKTVKSFKKYLDEVYISEDNFNKMLNIYGGIVKQLDSNFMRK